MKKMPRQGDAALRLILISVLADIIKEVKEAIQTSVYYVPESYILARRDIISM